MIWDLKTQKDSLKHLIGGLNYATNVVENRVSLNSLA